MRDTAGRFADYAGIVAGALGGQARMWVTHNEPWCASWLGYALGVHAPGHRDVGLAVAATHHLLLSHGRAVQAIRAAVPGAQVGIDLNLQPTRPATVHEDDLACLLYTSQPSGSPPPCHRSLLDRSVLKG